MTIDKILVLVISLSGIIFTYWFFLMKKDKEVRVSEAVDIIVDGGYTPEIISISLNKTTKINFLRTDASTCLEEVVISDFKIRKYLPLNQKITFEVKPEQKGT